MSSDSPTANPSRSASPFTPDLSDSPDNVSINDTPLELSQSWFISPRSHHWDTDQPFASSVKPDPDHMLAIDELLEQHAYADSPSPSFPSPSQFASPQQQHSKPSPSLQQPYDQQPRTDLTSNAIMSLVTQPVPPPAALARKIDPASLNQRVVHPPKESCINLPIMFPSIPEGGTKSRVETQVRVTVDLADSNTSSDPLKYARIGSWKWLKLPQGTATKRRTRKQGKIDPDPRDVLQLSAHITCATSPHNRVFSCSSCQAREAKRVAKKLAARVRPARSDTESGDNSNSQSSKPKHYEDTTSIIQFNCAEVLDFSTGSVVLPLRITCYCRHHREKVGFIVHFTMMDQAGRIVGTGSSRPIMITDDHKTATVVNARHAIASNVFPSLEAEWSNAANSSSNTTNDTLRAPSKRRKDVTPSVTSKRRPKPYDSNSKPVRPSREGSVISLHSPSTSSSNLPLTRSPTPPNSGNVSQFMLTDMIPPTPKLHHSSQISGNSSPDTFVTPLDQPPDVSMSCAPLHPEIPQDGFSLAIMPTHSHSHSLPYMFFGPQNPQTLLPPTPTIHRLIPNMGPTYGGIEVTVLGANFLPSMQLNCVFGDVMAQSTQRWSDNTLVCLLPPRATPGVVAVWFQGYRKAGEQSGAPPSLFTYTDESDRALMELALQVVGLKMTGKIEDAKNVAMRIVGNTGNDSNTPHTGVGGMMQMSPAPGLDIGSLLLQGETKGFENLVFDCLAILKTSIDEPRSKLLSIPQVLTHSTAGGQTVLHLAAFLKFPRLLKLLVDLDADLDVRDHNGYTPLHFAALAASEECARILLEGGADVEIVDALGKTAQEVGGKKFFASVVVALRVDEDGEESCWGDAEEEEENPPIRHPLSHWSSRKYARRGVLSKRPSRHYLISGASTPPPVQSAPSLPPETKDVDTKQSVWFMEMIQRTLSQIPAPQGILSNKLPRPHLTVPNVPWGALPQIPMVFPVFIPMMPGWPSFLGGEAQIGNRDPGTDTTGKTVSATHELRNILEKWMALVAATALRQQQQTEDAPPMYTPRETETGQASEMVPLQLYPQPQPQTPQPSAQRQSCTPDESPIHQEHTDQDVQGIDDVPRPIIAEYRRVAYNIRPVPAQEVESFAYRPATSQTRRLQRQEDRMLFRFWLPALLLSLMWAFHHAIRFAFHIVKSAVVLKTPLGT